MWEIIRPDVTRYMKEFFTNEKLLEVLNNTVITLMPKGKHATGVGDYRPIACCNTIYKVISKVMYNRLKNVLPMIISPCQSAFVKGRTIVQNILICQDLVRMYNRKAAMRRCMIKLDLGKHMIVWSRTLFRKC